MLRMRQEDSMSPATLVRSSQLHAFRAEVLLLALGCKFLVPLNQHALYHKDAYETHMVHLQPGMHSVVWKHI